MPLSISYPVIPSQTSVHAAAVMDQFGMGMETGPVVVANQLEIPAEPGTVICFTGPSGSGKSSLLRGLSQQVSGSLICLEAIELTDRLVIDGLGLNYHEGLELLSLCGLAEPALLLRPATCLSEGQKFRYRLALAIAAGTDWVMADEFTATLDRTLAKVMAYNVRRLCEKRKVGFLLATTHEDILPDLDPHVHVACCAEGSPIVRRGCTGPEPSGATDVKKKRSVLSTDCGLRPAFGQIGRTLLGGITAAII